MQPLIVLLIQTLLLWALVILLHRLKTKITLIPLYVAIAVLTLLAQNISDLGFALEVYKLSLPIGSVAFFTSSMLGILFLYLFEGPRATRFGIAVVVATAVFYFFIVGALGLQVDTTNWVLVNFASIRSHFWSLIAVIFDGFFIAISWELTRRFSNSVMLFRVFLVIFCTFALDSLIYLVGSFGLNVTYLPVLLGNLTIRLFLALIISPIITFYLQQEKYNEDGREQPKNFWEILNFRSDLETKLRTMEEVLTMERQLHQKLVESQEKYDLILEGANAGIWDWDIVKDFILYSPRFCELLGYHTGEIPPTLTDFKTLLLHPDDLERTFTLLDASLYAHKPFSVEYRLKTKQGVYKWFLCGGLVKFDTKEVAVRMVGSIIDIDAIKLISKSYEAKVAELERINKFMIDRELMMIALKKEIADLKAKLTLY